MPEEYKSTHIATPEDMDALLLQLKNLAPAEQARAAAELQRVSNESTRVANEASRQAELDAKVAKTDIVNNLTAGGPTVPLSAEQGKVIGASITQLSDRILDTQLLDYPISDILRKHTKQALGYSYVSVPNNASGGVEAIVKGSTLKNELNYNNATWAEWIKTSGCTGNSTGLSFDASVQGASCYISADFKPSTKYGVLLNIPENTLASGSIGLYENLASTPIPVGVPYNSIGNLKQSITSASTVTSSRLLFGVNVTSTGTIKLRDIRVFELPHGSTIESDFTNLTADQLAVKYPYVKGDAVKHTGAVRIVSVGKNLFDKSKVTNGQSVDRTTGNTYASAVNFCTGFRKVKPNTTYYMKNGSLAIAFYDHNYTFINPSGSYITVGTDLAFSFTTGANYGYTKFSGLLTNLDAIQLELGTVAAPYEPYTESIVYLPTIGKRVPNGTADEINVLWDSKTDGLKVVGTQKVSNEYTLVSADIYSFSSNTNVDSVQITVPSDCIPRTISENSGAIATNFSVPAYATFSDSVALAEKHLYGTGAWSADKIVYVVAHGKYADIAAARAALIGKTIRYQLATPITTFPAYKGTLRAYPNGTVYTEPCLYGYTKTAVTVITTAALPIKSIRKVIREDTTNHKVVETDVTANVTITDSNTSITIASFDATKNYFYDCEYDTQYSTNPEIVINAEVDGGVISHDYAAAAVAWTLTANEGKADILFCTNAGGAANIIAPAIDGKRYIIKNTSGQTLTLKTASSTGITILNGKTATCIYTGSDFIKVSEV